MRQDHESNQSHEVSLRRCDVQRQQQPRLTLTTMTLPNLHIQLSAWCQVTTSSAIMAAMLLRLAKGTIWQYLLVGHQRKSKLVKTC